MLVFLRFDCLMSLVFGGVIERLVIFEGGEL